jgi:hypothetical protein
MQEIGEEDKNFDFQILFEEMKKHFVEKNKPDMLRKMQIAVSDGIEELKNKNAEV